MTDALKLYRAKRDFSITSELAEGGEAGKDALTFVIQKHWASRLHHDLRLELDGVMLNWAVPQGPSFDPHDKRMALHVKDHPIAYASFEGPIPEKQYGAGKVIIWDQGKWVLIRMKGKGEKQAPWLLIVAPRPDVSPWPGPCPVQRRCGIGIGLHDLRFRTCGPAQGYLPPQQCTRGPVHRRLRHPSGRAGARHRPHRRPGPRPTALRFLQSPLWQHLLSAAGDFEGLSGALVAAVLRSSMRPTGAENTMFLKRVLQRIRRHFSDTHILVRGDGHFSTPDSTTLPAVAAAHGVSSRKPK